MLTELDCATDNTPFVVCCLLVSSMTSKVVPNSLFNSVPIRATCWIQLQHRYKETATHSFQLTVNQRQRRRCTRIQRRVGPISRFELSGRVCVTQRAICQRCLRLMLVSRDEREELLLVNDLYALRARGWRVAIHGRPIQC